MAMKRLEELLLGEVILNVNTTLLIFCVIIVGTVTKGSNGNEETRVAATKRGDIEC